MNEQSRHRAARRSQILLSGAVGGFIATIPMTIFMLATQPFLPQGQHYDLPPEIIIKELALRLHVRSRMNKPQILVVTLLSHFAYGSAMGAIYSPLEPRTLPVAPVQGSLFGLLVWAASYLGLLPLLHISASGHREPAHRNYMMIAAHLIWGIALGIITVVLKSTTSDN